jgi:hypothetical protein
MMDRMGTLALAALLAVSVGPLRGPVPLAAAAPAIFRVFVHLPPDDPSAPETPAELDDLHHSVADLDSALGDRKKSFVVVDAEDKADVSVEVLGRSVTIPRVVFAPASPMGQPGAPMSASPAKAVHLRVRATFRGGAAEFTNKNQALESTGGWKSAAEDLAKQLDLWVHRPEGR